MQTVGSYCETIIAEWLVIGMVTAGMNGIDKGKLYVTVTVTRFPGLLQGAGEVGQVDPLVKAVHAVFTVITVLDVLIPGSATLCT